jgi:hypothetical protein
MPMPAPRTGDEIVFDFKLDESDAFGGWTIVEFVVVQSPIMTSKVIRKTQAIVRLVGPAFEPKMDLQPGDLIVFGGGSAVDFEGKGPGGGKLVAVRPDQIITVNRSWRKPKVAAPNGAPEPEKKVDHA